MVTQAGLAFQKEDELIPPALRLVRDFVNTVEYQVDDERWGDPSRLGEWLVEHRLLAASAAVGESDLELAMTMREGLRAVLLTHAGHDADEEAVRELNAALEEIPVRVAFETGEAFALVPTGGDPVRRALGGVLDAVRRATEDGTWARLKVCDRDSCRWAYYDHSRNRSGRWCTMAGCGNAVKMRRAHAARRSRPQSAHE
jgi:predicted RNA-binding Zn ribbon-like protein